MQQSSSAIGSLAGGLAKAQIELVNTEKSMIATIRADGKGGGEQIFRYAQPPAGAERSPVTHPVLGQTSDSAGPF